MNATIFVKTWGSLVLAMAATVTTLPVEAQETGSLSSQVASVSQQAQNYTVLHVDVATGDDRQGLGSANQPYQTITQALAMAPSTSTVILLAPGHYSQASGEQFPLRLRPGVTIQGNAGEARNTMIVGSGEFYVAGTPHNATIVTADRSGLANLAISNPQGNGVWINAGTPVLRRLVLVSNAVAGVQVTDSAPVIENSYFHRNQLGLAIQGEGRAAIRGNYFEATGRAITVASPATPTINNNRIARNDVGIALKNNARPILEANVLNGNGRNGVVEVESTVATSAVAPAVAPREEITVSADPEPEPEPTAVIKPLPQTSEPRAVLLPAPVPEQSDQSVVVAAAPAAVVQIEIGEPMSVGHTDNEVLDEAMEIANNEPEMDLTVSEDPETGSVDAGSFRQHLAASIASDPVEEQPPIVQRHQIALSAPAHDSSHDSSTVATVLSDAPLDEGAVAIAVIPASGPESDTDVARDTHLLDVGVNNGADHGTSQEGISKLLTRLRRSSAPESVAVGGGSPAVPVAAVPDNSARGSVARLPVPSATIPSSHGAGNLTPPGTASVARVFRYQVLVDMDEAEDLQVLVPDAFRTQVGRRTFMQAGAYVDEAEAQERLDWLWENGIEARVNLRE